VSTKPANEGDSDRPIQRFSEDFLVTLCGAATSLVTAGLLVAIEELFELSIYTWIVWFVIPAGALFAGFAAATGYWAGARLFNHRPSRLLLLNMVAVSVGTFFAVHYLGYSRMDVHGTPLRTLVPFTTFLDRVLTHASISFQYRDLKLGTTGELGPLGYAYALLQILGFAAGGLGVYLWLLSRPYCETCGRYFRRIKRVYRYAAFPESLRALDGIGDLLDAGRYSEAVAAWTEFGIDGPGAYRFRTELSIWQCKVCSQQILRFSIAERSDNDWKDFHTFTARVRPDSGHGHSHPYATLAG
jgi:hypothetical protein